MHDCPTNASRHAFVVVVVVVVAADLLLVVVVVLQGRIELHSMLLGI